MKITIDLDHLSNTLMWEVNRDVDILQPIIKVYDLEAFLIELAKRTKGNIQY